MDARDGESFQRYLGFGPEDERALRALARAVEPVVAPLLDDFYARILADPQAASVLEDPGAVVALRAQLRGWIARILAGPWDADGFERSARIGRRHVEVGLPLRFMPLAMNVMREHLHRLVFATERDAAPQQRALCAVDRALDLELTIMLETYAEDSSDKLCKTQRLATIGQLAASLSHELRNPIGVIQTSLMIVRKCLGAGADPQVIAALDRIGRSARLSSDLCGQLLEFARVKNPRRLAFPLRALVDEALAQVEVPASVRLVADTDPEHVEVSADPADLSRMVANLVRNAVQAILTTGRPGTVTVRARLEGDVLALAVQDDGPGMTPDVAARVFEPLYTTRANGTGLGLTICRDIATAHGGSLDLVTAPGRGATFTARLPHSAPSDRGARGDPERRAEAPR